jgi:hypothetical protein
MARLAVHKLPGNFRKTQVDRRALTSLHKVQLLSFNRTQSRVIIGLLTGHNTLTRHLYVMRMSSNATGRKCGTEMETSVHVLCEC